MSEISGIPEALLRRRSVVLGSLAVAGAAGLAACSGSTDEGLSGGASAGSSASSDGPSGASTASGSAGAAAGVSMEVSDEGLELDMIVGPTVRSTEHTVVPVTLTLRDDTDISTGISANLAFEGVSGVGSSLAGTFMLDLEAGLVYGETDTTMKTGSSDAGEPFEVFPVYGPVPEDLTSVTVFVPGLGVVTGVPVVDEADSDLDVGAVVAEATIDPALAGPFPIESFATDSADLSAQADTVLATVVAELDRYPSGGTLDIVGHTDDVADEAYNQDLSQRRAQAVSDRLAQLTDLSAWQVTVSGKGETQPRVADTSEEARAANRRVEITATPTSPEEAKPPTAQDDGELPTTTAPTTTGEQGVDTTVDDVTLHLALPEVTRVGGYLTGNVELTSTASDLFAIRQYLVAGTTTAGSRWTLRQHIGSATGLSLLTNQTRYYPVDFTRDDLVFPLTYRSESDVDQGITIKLPVVWPDTGQDTVTLDLPVYDDPNAPRAAARLTDIPVTDA